MHLFASELLSVLFVTLYFQYFPFFIIHFTHICLFTRPTEMYLNHCDRSFIWISRLRFMWEFKYCLLE